MTELARRIRAVFAESCPTGASFAILSVENKETFHVMAARLPPVLPPAIAGIVSSAGHPNDAVNPFLRVCVKAGARIFHYGDLDPDGILIAQEIASLLAVPVVP